MNKYPSVCSVYLPVYLSLFMYVFVRRRSELRDGVYAKRSQVLVLLVFFFLYKFFRLLHHQFDSLN